MAQQPRHLLSVADLAPGEIRELLDHALEMKRDGEMDVLRGKSVALLFEKPSLRTKVSFDLAVSQLGGHPLFLGPEEVGLGTREPIPDVARVLSGYVDALVVRTFAQESLEELARYATIPVINALSDAEHPCQALADMLTLYELRHQLRGLTVAFIGDGNNVAASLALAASSLGLTFRIASPEGYELPLRVRQQAEALAREQGGVLQQLRDPRQAVAEADVVYTDVWTNMGQEAEGEQRQRAFAGYQVTPELLAQANPGALFMHPLPAHPGEEIASGLLERPQSVVFQQAANRLHAQKAVLSWVFQPEHAPWASSGQALDA